AATPVSGSAARRKARTGWSRRPGGSGSRCSPTWSSCHEPASRHGGRDGAIAMSDQPFTKSEMMIVAAARELAGQRVCFVGVGLPNIAVNLAKRTIAPDLELVYEAG